MILELYVNKQAMRLIYRDVFKEKSAKSTSTLTNGGPQFVRERESRINISPVASMVFVTPT